MIYLTLAAKRKSPEGHDVPITYVYNNIIMLLEGRSSCYYTSTAAESVRRRAMRCRLDIFYPPEIEISRRVGIFYTNNNNLIIYYVVGLVCCPPEFDVRLR